MRKGPIVHSIMLNRTVGYVGEQEALSMGGVPIDGGEKHVGNASYREMIRGGRAPRLGGGEENDGDIEIPLLPSRVQFSI